MKTTKTRKTKTKAKPTTKSTRPRKRRALPARSPDIYDREVERLKWAGKGALMEAWYPKLTHVTHVANSPLFAFTSKDRKSDGGYGCLTQVKRGIKQAPTTALTKAIRADTRIPDDPYRITPASLPVFAEWQRRIDKTLGRDVPALRRKAKELL